MQLTGTHILGSPLIELDKLGCERSGRQLFAGLSASIEAGQIVQIHGPNGSGKTSLLRLLTGVASDFSGELRWRGQPLARAMLDYRSHLLFIGHLSGIKRPLTPRENLAWYAGMHAGLPQLGLAAALAEVGLAGYEDVPCDHLSAGQLRRVALARLFLTPARVWILDEPFTALDVEGVAKLEARIAEHAAGRGVVILTTHQKLSLSKVTLINLLDYCVASDDYAA